MKISKIIAAGFILAASTGNAQINETPVHAGGRMISSKKAAVGQPQGSVFVNDNYMLAVQENTGAKLMARYDAYNDQFECKNMETGQIASLPKTANDKIIFSGTRSTYIYT